MRLTVDRVRNNNCSLEHNNKSCSFSRPRSSLLTEARNVTKQSPHEDSSSAPGQSLYRSHSHSDMIHCAPGHLYWFIGQSTTSHRHSNMIYCVPGHLYWFIGQSTTSHRHSNMIHCVPGHLYWFIGQSTTSHSHSNMIYCVPGHLCTN